MSQRLRSTLIARGTTSRTEVRLNAEVRVLLGHLPKETR
jgi:hypothetical protein